MFFTKKHVFSPGCPATGRASKPQITRFKLFCRGGPKWPQFPLFLGFSSFFTHFRHLHAKVIFFNLRTRPGLLYHLRSLTAVYSFFFSGGQKDPKKPGFSAFSRIWPKSGFFGHFDQNRAFWPNLSFFELSPGSSGSSDMALLSQIMPQKVELYCSHLTPRIAMSQMILILWSDLSYS